MGTYSWSLSLNHISQWEKITGIHLNRVRNLNVSLPATALVRSSSCDVALKDLLIPKNILLSLIFYRWEVSMLSLSNLKDPEFLSFPVCFSSIETGKFSLSSSLTHVTRVPSFNLFAHIQQFGVTRWFNSKESICQSRRCLIPQLHFRCYTITLANGNDGYASLFGICTSMIHLLLIHLTSCSSLPFYMTSK